MKGIRKASFITGGIILVVLLLIGFQPARGPSAVLAQRVKREAEMKNLAYMVIVYAKNHAENLPATFDSLSDQRFESSGTDGILCARGDPIYSFAASDVDPEVFSRNSYIASKDNSHVLVFERPGLSPDHIVRYIELDLEGKWRCNPNTIEIKQCTEQQLTGLILKLNSPPANLSPADSLIAAAENGQIDKIGALLGRGVSIDENDRRGWTALNAATEHDQAGVVEFLISKRVKINLRDNVGMGRTALMRACALGHSELVDTLLAHGADLHVKLDDGTTALTEALPYPTIVQKLIAAGAKINEHSESQLSPFLAASSLGYAGTVGVLIDHGADLQKEGLMALEAASRTGQADVIETLLSKGVGASKKDLGEDLSWAYCYPAAIKELIAGGADLNAQCTCPGGGTALMSAALNGCPESVNALIGAGADLNAKDDEGHTVLDLMLASTRTDWTPRSPVEMKSLADIIDTLRKHGAIESGLHVDRFESH